MSEPLFSGKVVLVTGAAGGIGRSVAELCAREGAKLVLADVGADREGQGADPDVVARLASELRGPGVEIAYDASDVAAPGAAGALVALAKDRFGRLDAVVSCAGFTIDRSVLKTDDALLRRVLDVHVSAPFALLRAAGTLMVEQKTGGSIVLASGPAAYFGARGQAAIGAAHAALVAMARSAALELRRHEVRVNAIVPTARTRANEDLPTFAAIPEGAMSPAHVAAMVGYLLSSLASEVNGEVIGVAGARAYGLKTRETPGAFADGGPADPRWYAEKFREAMR
jgi:NAD(P)-dependent dehydrogenase (short-subunit alcohol dehydrogenase family)